MAQLRTAEEVRADFVRRGLSISGWAREHDLKPHVVYMLLSDKTRHRGVRGASHKAAVLLGMKHGVIEVAEAKQ